MSEAAVTCSTCRACCCRLEVMLMGDDEPPRQMTLRDRWGGWVMRRLEDGWCIALDRQTMLCSIYEQRPFVCREYQEGDYDCLEQRKQLVAVKPENP
ncbi:MAG: YkgJ family cysteine cluster protein [Azonexus sp.]|nr:YkgJ family cysteine cluster protein [Azonexus sp.]